MQGRVASCRALGALIGGIVVTALALAPAANAELRTHADTAVPCTTPGLHENVADAAGCLPGADAPTCHVIALPGTSGAQAPEDDLADALERLATTDDPAAAAAAVDEARAILAGNPLPGRAYSGMGLLNWDPWEKVKTVAAGGTVTVDVVPTPQHTLSDTWLLKFDDPSQPYALKYRISEAGGAAIGELRPTPLLADGGGPIGGLMSAVVPLSTASRSTT